MKRIAVAVVSALLTTASLAHGAVILNQVQTFDDPHGWVVGVGPGPGVPQDVPVALGGPGGPTDPFLSLVSTGGSGPGSRLSAQNFSVWAGDYLSAGIEGLRMDVRNFGTTDLMIRLLFVDFDGPDPENVAVSDLILIPGGADWHTIKFDITPAALFGLLGTVEGALANTDELRIVHSPSPVFIPTQVPAIAGALGVDNITAVPEPATILLLGMAALYGVRRRLH